MKSKSSIAFTILLITVVVAVVACVLLSAFGGVWRDKFNKDFWSSVLKKIDWHKFPWQSFPWSILPDNFPWDAVPWREMPWGDIAQQVDWGSIDWSQFPFEKLPGDFPYDELPLEGMPDDFWGNMNWGDLNDDFPFDRVPWEERPSDFWDDFPFEDLPDDFPWAGLPWDNIQPDQVPDGSFPDGFYPEQWDHEHQYESEEWTLVTAPTCGAPGVESNFCLICHRTITRVIPATGQHVFGDDGICSVCGLRRLVLVSSDKSKVYDGIPLDGTCNIVFASGSAPLKEGHRINYEALRFATCNGVYSVSNRFWFEDGAAVVDMDGNNVTSEYAMVLAFGTLTVTQRDLVVTTLSAEKLYDGTALTRNEFACSGLVEGHRLVDVKFDDGQIEPGRRQNRIIEYRIVDEAGNDVTNYYKVSFVFGWLSVTV